LSFIQILLSFALEYKTNINNSIRKFKLKETYKKISKDKNIKEFFKTEFFLGMAYEGALDTCVTLLIIIAFSKDFSLGVITSVISILSIFSAYICKRIINPRKVKSAVYISCIVPLLSTFILLFITNSYTIIGYSIIYSFFIQIVSIINDIKTFKITNSDIVNDTNRVETYVLFELFLGFGRIFSYVLLIIVGLLNIFYLLKVLIIFLTISILFGGIHLTKIEVD
jgi:hypothetical protein